MNPQERLSKSQINKNYLAKLKTTPKYNEYKAKRAEAMKKYRLKKKNAENDLPIKDRQNVIEKQRKVVREQNYQAR